MNYFSIPLTYLLAFFLIFTAKGFSQEKDPKQIDPLAISVFNKDTPKDQLHVFLFLGTDCPISQKYVHTLKELYNEFSEVSFYGIIPHHFSQAQIEEYQKDYEIPFQLYRDHHNKLTHLFKATITPEAFLIDSEGTVYYQGAIDNWFYALGRNRPKATEHYLKDAINQVSALQPVTISRTEAIGCMIEMKH